MLHRSALLLAGLLVSGCASYTAEYEDRLARSLPRPRDVSISDSKTYPGKILCGRYITTTAQGFSMRTGQFVVGPHHVLSSPSEDQIMVYCSNDPEQALYDRAGIGAPDGNWVPLIKVRDDMLAIDRAITNYYNTANTLPRTLENLLEGDFGVNADMLTDPWGRPYRYAGGLSGRTAPQYQLGSYGEDGEPGGKGQNADISRAQIALLDHVLRVAGY
jgi:hypothetical protein